jgi:hypothetical protein
MGDPFVPEADAIDQEREIEQAPPAEAERAAPLEYPRRIPIEAPDADVLEQNQPVLGDDEDWRD